MGSAKPRPATPPSRGPGWQTLACQVNVQRIGTHGCVPTRQPSRHDRARGSVASPAPALLLTPNRFGPTGLLLRQIPTGVRKRGTGLCVGDCTALLARQLTDAPRPVPASDAGRAARWWRQIGAGSVCLLIGDTLPDAATFLRMLSG